MYRYIYVYISPVAVLAQTMLARALPRGAPGAIYTQYNILYYTILYYTILYYTILYYTILYYTILYYTILYYTILYYNMI